MLLVKKYYMNEKIYMYVKDSSNVNPNECCPELWSESFTSDRLFVGRF